MIRIMIVDDDEIICSQLLIFLKKEQNLSVVNVSHTGYETIDNYLKLNPDVLILDLKLPDITGLDVLKELSVKEEKVIKNVIILSGEANLINSVYKEKKVYRYFVKPFNFTSLLDTINEIFYTSYFDDDNFLYNYINNMLWKLQFNVHSKGTTYLIDAIFTAYRKQSFLYHTQELIQEIAKENKTNTIAVRSAIDKSISSMFRYTDITIISNFFNEYYDGRKLSTKYFISLVVNYLNIVNEQNSQNKYKCVNL